ncbi:hypothetical protein DOY81_013927 [Sarcophaga bullata]|nr:hypothetical protein DOY81_013927 [Sarcophaga bullata]
MASNVLCAGVWLLQTYGACVCFSGPGFTRHQCTCGQIGLHQVSGRCSEFKVRSYPTIMFIKGNMEYTYSGDRSKDELVDYALRMSGPPVQLVTRTESVDMLKGSHTIFFMFVGPQEGVVWDTFYAAAENYQEHGFFYATSEDVAASTLNLKSYPLL